MWTLRTRERSFLLRLCLAALTFVTGCLCIVVFDAIPKLEIGLVLCFVLCLFTMLVLLYQCVAPCWTRNDSNVNLYTYAVLDCLSTILWLSASAGVAVRIAKSISADGLGVAITTLAAMICVLFGVAAYSSVGGAWFCFENGFTPSRSSSRDEMGLEDLDKVDAWSKALDKHTKPKIAKKSGRVSIRDRFSDRFTFMQSTETADGRHPGRKISYGGQKKISYHQDSTPSALSPTEWGERSPAVFPTIVVT